MRASSYSQVFVVLTLVGCSSNVPRQHPAHTLMFAEEGQPVALKSASTPSASSRYHNLDYEEFEMHLDTIFSGLEAAVSQSPKPVGPKPVLVFIHGGLNTAGTSLERVDRLLDQQTCQASTAGCISDHYYPIFINWRSSLWSSYRDHLFLVRQGERKGGMAIATSPFIFSADVISALGSALPASAEELADARVAGRDDDWKYVIRQARSGDLADKCFDLRLGTDRRSRREKTLNAVKWFPWGVAKIATLPVIDGFGQEAWEIMLRRTNLLFEPETRNFPRFRGDGAEGDGGLSEFFRRLRDFKRQHPDVALTIVGHSAGAIILNKALRHFGDIRFDNVVYMAAACTIEDYQNTIFGGAGTRAPCDCERQKDCLSQACMPGPGARGYLRRHPQSQVHHLMLNELAELFESRLGWFEVVPRGSLLTWIDNFLADPEYRLHRTAGRAFNLLREIDRTPEDLRARIHFKIFDYGRSVTKEPQSHGGFDNFAFWHADFRKTSVILPAHCERPPS